MHVNFIYSLTCIIWKLGEFLNADNHILCRWYQFYFLYKIILRVSLGYANQTNNSGWQLVSAQRTSMLLTLLLLLINGEILKVVLTNFHMLRKETATSNGLTIQQRSHSCWVPGLGPGNQVSGLQSGSFSFPQPHVSAALSGIHACRWVCLHGELPRTPMTNVY